MFGIPASMINMSALRGNQEDVEVPASQKALDGLKRLKVREMKINDHDNQCPVCMEDFSKQNPDFEVLEMPCQHKFCGPCLNEWLRKNHNCPVCRAEIEGEPRVETDT